MDGDDIDVTTPKLPEAELPHAPSLSHDLFLAESFDVDSFLLQRRHTSLDDLRSELRIYLAELRNELVGVINEDYEDFIGLGIGLRGTDRRLERMRRPVENVRTEIEATRSELVELQTAIQAKLDERSAIRESKATLRLLLSINDSVLKVEALLLIESPEDPDLPVASTSKLEPVGPMSPSKHHGRSRPLDRSAGSGVKRTERVASEYSQLLYLIEKADGLAFVKTLDARVDNIRKTLQRDMSSLLSNALHAKPASTDALYDILRIFQATKKQHEAEEVIRRELVRPWLQKHVNRDALSAPQSPVIPVTPGILKSSFPPFTDSPSTDSSATFEPIPATGSFYEPLVDLYNKILTFVSRDCVAVLEASDRRLRGSLLISVVWQEVQHRLVAELGHIIFAAGRPESFHANYLTTSAFISRFEAMCPTQQQLLSLRSHDSFVAFGKRWQMPVYFQLRFKEIATRLEEALDARNGLDSRTAEGSPFLLSATEATHRAMWTCWQPDVVLAELTPRFWRFSLQLLSRYKRWLDDVMPSHVSSSANGTPVLPKEVDRLGTSSPISRAGTPAQEPSEEAIMKQLTLIIVDVRRLESHAIELFASTISPLLQVSPADGEATPQAALQSTAASVAAVGPSLATQIVSTLVKQCNEPLRPSLRSVVSEVRLSNKAAPPMQPSHLVPRVLKPLKAYLDGFPGREMDAESRALIAGDVLDEIATRYASVLVDNREAEASLRRLKRGRQGFSLFGRSTTSPATVDAEGGAEDGNVKAQLQLDAETFADEARVLGVVVEGKTGFAALVKAVQ